ncbi:MAG: hypothetical protein QNJ68_03520 [Microcoleaceae cyanobacterium MO_207.B10]|nr:hypothetical protein [Microcoleaceae cyanobacterium MO_207.B10]
MNYRIIPAPISIPSPTPPVEFTSQVTTKPSLPDGGTLETPIASTVTEILAISSSQRSVFIHNKGPGIVHLYIGDVPAGWEAAPESATKVEPGGFAASSLESSKAKLSGWSEGGTADLVVDVVS